MPKPQGSCGATKMKILAIICNNCDDGQESYGYDIWRIMKESFHIYLDDKDIGNVYHHLNDLCALNYVSRDDSVPDGRCFYNVTDEGRAVKTRYSRYIEILRSSK
jgi:DNA-binding PadR family transcriptional regulator